MKKKELTKPNYQNDLDIPIKENTLKTTKKR